MKLFLLGKNRNKVSLQIYFYDSFIYNTFKTYINLTIESETTKTKKQYILCAVVLLHYTHHDIPIGRLFYISICSLCQSNNKFLTTHSSVIHSCTYQKMGGLCVILNAKFLQDNFLHSKIKYDQKTIDSIISFNKYGPNFFFIHFLNSFLLLSFS